MIFKIKPLIGVGDLKFGMTQSQVREVLGDSCKSFKRTPSVNFPSDYYASLGIFVEYKEEGIVEALEFCEPSSLLFNKIDLMLLSFNELQRLLKNEDESPLEIENCSVTSYSTGVSGYFPFCKEDNNAQIESILVFERDYY